MAKKKARKVDRTIEKLLRTGRYWEWLKEVESEHREAQYTQERAEVWRNLMRRALRDPASFHGFCEEVKGVKSLPNSPDFTFLMTLKGFIDGTRSLEDLSALKGLGQPAETLRQRALSWHDDVAPVDGMRKNLKVFVTQPDKVTARYYEQAAQNFHVSGLEHTAKVMAANIATVRRLNSKGGVEKGWKAVDFDELEKIDAFLARGMQTHPQALWRILIHPFVRNIALLMERLSKVGGAASMAKLVTSLPFLFQQVAGDKAEAILAQLRAFHPEGMAGVGIAQLESQIDSAEFEEKVMLLNALRNKLKEKPKEQSDPIEMFFDEIEEDEEDNDKFYQVFRRLFDKILNEIQQKAKEIGPRDEKELRRIMDQMVAADLDLLIDAPDRSADMARLFSRLAAAGCLGKRLALFALLVARVERSTTLQSSAEEVLDRSGPVMEEDLQWVLHEAHPLYFPQLRVLAPFLDRFPRGSEAYGLILREILSELREFVFICTSSMDMPGMSGKRGKKVNPNVEKVINRLRQESAELKDYHEFHLIPAFLDCFPHGTYTQEGFLRWLNYLRDHSENYLRLLETELQELARKKTGVRDLFFMVGHLIDSIEEQVLTIFGFLKEHIDDLFKADASVLQGLLSKMLLFKTLLKQDTGVIVRLVTVLQKRFDEGDLTVAPLIDTLKLTIKEIAYPVKRVGRRKGKKRQ